MYDKDLAIDILSQIYQATLTIIKRFSSVKTVGDFTDSITNCLVIIMLRKLPPAAKLLVSCQN